MKRLRYTLTSDGSSDEALIPIINWLVEKVAGSEDFHLVDQFADPRDLRAENRSLPVRVKAALHQYPCDVLFIHRDAEREPYESRLREIQAAAQQALEHVHVPVIPVRMTEAWLLVDERAIRQAAGNPAGSVPLNLPRLRRLEEENDPKSVLNQALLQASEMRGRRRKTFNKERSLAPRRKRVAELIADYSTLDQLSAFARFRETAAEAVHTVLSNRG